ncbi:MAG: UbiA family prenyltransferase [Planctomycetes bacterium]|nr:UbiA family prenyltransferase [Planctomycetota bacterium]
MNRLRVYAQLVRLPNLPSALADVCLAGFALAAQPPVGRLVDGFPFDALLLLLLSSACLYSSGMVWNDYFDLEQDRRERPFRPLPSGRVKPGEAVRLGAGLMAAGAGCAFVAGRVSLWLALVLVAAILAYDGWLKRTWAGPVGMGLCRFLNVLLGVSLAGTLAVPWALHLATVVGLYIAGVTWFARTEARQSSQSALQGAAAIMLASLVLALPLPVRGERAASSVLFPYLLVALGFLIGLPVSRAIVSPTPSHVQAAVKRCLLGLIVLDAVLATALGGVAGLLILVLLVPALALNWQKWLYAT